MIIGIDQSMTCTGIVIFDDSDRSNYKMIHHAVIKTAKIDGSIFVRFNIITSELIKLIKEYNINIVNIEGLPMGRSIGNSHKDLAALQGVIICKILEETGIICNIYTPTTVKKFATGSGKAKKEDMVAALPEDIRNRFLESGLKKSTGLYDCADAYFIGSYQ